MKQKKSIEKIISAEIGKLKKLPCCSIDFLSPDECVTLGFNIAYSLGLIYHQIRTNEEKKSYFL